MGLTELTTDELKQRIAAARMLRNNMHQDALAAKFELDGMRKTTLPRLERGQVTLTRSIVETLKRHLRVPDEWFLQRDVIVEIDLGDGKVRRLPRPQRLPTRREADLAVRRTQAGAATQGDYEVLVTLASAAGAAIGADESLDEADRPADKEPRP